MISANDAKNVLDADKKRLIIERYLRDTFKEQYNPAWLGNMANFTQLSAALDHINKLDNGNNSNLAGIGSNNPETRKDYTAEYLFLKQLLDKQIKFTNTTPPVATGFDEKNASLLWLEENQKVARRSLRDLHAQHNNLGVAEKLLNGELGATEWLGEVDLERMLIKLNIKNSTHITRLNPNDIGMILHFEREKHGNSNVPYTIPLLINCGNNGSLRAQGSHWTCAIVAVNPVTNSVSIDYKDSMPLRGNERDILLNAINYQDAPHRAFPNAAAKNINPTTDNLQKDSWSCGYRALQSLITNPRFPGQGNINYGADWQRLANAGNDSVALRDAVYHSLLDRIQLDPRYVERMKLANKVTPQVELGQPYNLDSKFTQNYMESITSNKKAANSISSAHCVKEYVAFVEALKPLGEIASKNVDAKNVHKKIYEVLLRKDLSEDAKLFAMLDVMATAYASLGVNNKVSQQIKALCEQILGVEIGVNPRYQVKNDGVIRRLLDAQAEVKPESLLPPIQKKTVGSNPISQSAPTLSSAPKVEPRITPSEGSISQSTLRKNKELSRLGSMFGPNQFCYAQKPSGVEPGFRAIDLDDAFFKELERILADPQNVKKANDKLMLAELDKALKKVDLNQKQKIFADFIHSFVPGPHDPKQVHSCIGWLCDQVKEGVAKNEKLSSWMYKLDYAEGQKERTKANKEAIREFVGTRLAGIFSAHNQRQELAWVNNKGTDAHALLACAWKNGLQELTSFLHNGGEPDYNGILVDKKNVSLTHSKQIPGLAKNLIFGIAVGDRDGVGKDAQNKGFADGAFYGFDYGKPYEGEGVCASLQDDFSFTNPYANVPAMFRGSSAIGVARHAMYRNYTIFYDTELSERMVGFHLLKKMITGKNPDEEVIQSFPGLRQELRRIEENTPSPQGLLKQMAAIKSSGVNASKIQALVDTYSMEIATGKASHFDLYFIKIKTDMIEMAVKSGMPHAELDDYIKFVDSMAAQAHKNNQLILMVFEQRMPLTRHELNLLDHLEKYCSKSSAVSPDAKVLLNTLRIDPPEGRIPFQLKHEENGTYTLSTTNNSVAKTLGEEFGLAIAQSSRGLSCNLSQEKLNTLVEMVENKYHQKKDLSQLYIICDKNVFPRVAAIVNAKNEHHQEKADISRLWSADQKTASLKIVPKTEVQAQQLTKIFGDNFRVNQTKVIPFNQDEQMHLKNNVNKLYGIECPSKPITTPAPLSSQVPHKAPTINRWQELHDKHSAEQPTAAEQLIQRFEALIKPGEVLNQIKNAINEANPQVAERLLKYNNKSLINEENIRAIYEDQLEKVKEVSDEVAITVSTTAPIDQIQPTL
ncbi:hypothetical protein [Legionella rowbothamii]|uniref:hypothetical protein n=1 Tax=Legionella rowbothamii TaxID=96229 RepID=UPI001055F124|nr:hypothetical protein [Legionella rowbothamii]